MICGRSGLSVALLDRRERIEVALDGADELVALVVGGDDPKLLLPPLPLTISPRRGAEAPIEARFLHRDGKYSREDEE